MIGKNEEKSKIFSIIHNRSFFFLNLWLYYNKHEGCFINFFVKSSSQDGIDNIDVVSVFWICIKKKNRRVEDNKT